MLRTPRRFGRKHLTVYFRERLGKARLAIIGRSARLSWWSFQRNPDDFGAHAAPQTAGHSFGHQATPHEQTEYLCGCISEPTATIVWGALLKTGVCGRVHFVERFQWHSFDPRRGLLSNRMPNKSEQLSGRPVLKAFLELFPCEQIVALGKIAAAQLEQLGVNAHCIRHPAPAAQNFFASKSRDRSLIVRQTTAFGGSLFLINAVRRSIGRGKNVVVLCSLEISRIVCRKRSCSAIGSLLIIAAACTIFSAA